MPLFGRDKPPGAMKPVNWKTNLGAVWISQFISLSAFYFCLPFLPLYLKEKEIIPADQTAFWSGVLIAAAPVSMMIMSPIWGTLGDRYGRKMMLVRATLAGAFVLYLMGVVDNIEALIVLRLLQGAFTGTIPSAQSLVAAATPEKHQGLALGLMMAAINVSYTAGAYFGGFFAELYGAEATFKIAGLLLVFATIIVVAVVRENFTPPVRVRHNTQSARIRHRKAGIDQFKAGIPALAAIAFVAWIMTFDGPFLPLYVEELFHGDPIAAAAAGVSGEVFRLTGNINALASVIAVGGSISISYIMDKRVPRSVWVLICLGAAGGIWILSHYANLTGLAVGRSVFLFFTSGLASILVVLFSRMTPTEKRGSAMGWTVTARSIGWTLSPLIAGILVQWVGYAMSYAWLGGFTLLLIPLFLMLTSRYREAFQGKDVTDDDFADVFDQAVLAPQSLPVTPKQSGRFTAATHHDETGTAAGSTDGADGAVGTGDGKSFGKASGFSSLEKDGIFRPSSGLSGLDVTPSPDETPQAGSSSTANQDQDVEPPSPRC